MTLMPNPAATLVAVLDKLAVFTSRSAPVVSLYLDLRPDQHGHRQYEKFVHEAFTEQIESFPTGSEARISLENDAQRIRHYLEDQLRPSTQTLVMFSSAGDPPLWEALQLDVPIDGHRLYVDRAPHLFPLARLNDRYAVSAALVLDTHAARLYVVALGTVQQKMTIDSEKPERVLGGWMSEPRYQRSVENLHLKHIKEVAKAVERAVSADRVRRVLVAADRVALPLLKENLPRAIRDLLVDLDDVDMKSSDSEILRALLAELPRRNALSDAEQVDEALAAFRAGGLGLINVEPVRAALVRGQVDHLLVPAVAAVQAADETSSSVEASIDKSQPRLLDEKIIEELTRLAHATDAHVTFVENGTLLEPAGGVAAILRFHF